MIDGGRAAVDNARAGGDSSPVDTPIEPSALASPASFPASGIPFHGVYGFPGALRVSASGGIVARLSLEKLRKVKLYARALGWSWFPGKPWSREDFADAVGLHGGAGSYQVALFERVAA